MVEINTIGVVFNTSMKAVEISMRGVENNT
jgi:hypothetical protein